jgi:hypothetical protein
MIILKYFTTGIIVPFLALTSVKEAIYWASLLDYPAYNQFMTFLS